MYSLFSKSDAKVLLFSLLPKQKVQKLHKTERNVHKIAYLCNLKVSQHAYYLS